MPAHPARLGRRNAYWSSGFSRRARHFKSKTELTDINQREASFNKEKVSTILEKYEIRSIKADDVVELFLSTINMRYSDPTEEVKLESFSLFD